MNDNISTTRVPPRPPTSPQPYLPFNLLPKDISPSATTSNSGSPPCRRPTLAFCQLNPPGRHPSPICYSPTASSPYRRHVSSLSLRLVLPSQRPRPRRHAPASSCPRTRLPSLPIVVSGWQAQLVAGGLTKPRSIAFDSTGALLVVESGKGISRHRFTENGGTCLSSNHSHMLVEMTSVRLRAIQRDSPAC
ncbi:hypothetical protein VTI74DRAFT_4074 [Chaetomium olivicolor]